MDFAQIPSANADHGNVRLASGGVLDGRRDHRADDRGRRDRPDDRFDPVRRAYRRSWRPTRHPTRSTHLCSSPTAKACWHGHRRPKPARAAHESPAYIDGKWTTLDPDIWPTGLIHAIPLIDGTVLRLIRTGGKVDLSLMPLSAGKVDEAEIEKLVERLSEADPRDRAEALRELTRYGPAAWPVLERLKDDQPPEAQLRIAQVLRDRTRPTLGGMSLVDGKLHVVSRDRAGGAVYFAGRGVATTDAADRPVVVRPAWIAVRPGRAPELLPDAMTADLRPGESVPQAVGGEWVVADPTHVLRRYSVASSSGC
jgi:hypothetical protein